MTASLISRIGSGNAEATTVTIPAGHQAGDVLLIYAFRDGSLTNPTLPAGWVSLGTPTTGSLASATLGWKLASSASETSGTWTNATGLMVHVYRGGNPVTPFGSIFSGTGTTSPSTYSASTGVTKARTDNQWLVAFQGHRSIDTTTMNTAPTGYTNVINFQTGATNNMVSFDTNGPTEVGFASNTVAPGGTASDWITSQIALYPPSFVLNNFQSVHSVSAGVMSVTEKIR